MCDEFSISLASFGGAGKHYRENFDSISQTIPMCDSPDGVFRVGTFLLLGWHSNVIRIAAYNVLVCQGT